MFRILKKRWSICLLLTLFSLLLFISCRSTSAKEEFLRTLFHVDHDKMEELEKLSAQPEQFVRRYYRDIESMLNGEVYDYLANNRIPHAIEKELSDIGGQMHIRKLEFTKGAENTENFRFILQLQNAENKIIKEIEIYGQLREDGDKITKLYFHNLKDLKLLAE